MLGFTRARVETERWTALHSHYGLEVFYRQPGLKGAHEKGDVEGEVGRFRRNHLVPVPEAPTLAELNASRAVEAPSCRVSTARERLLSFYQPAPICWRVLKTVVLRG
ncbi:hypothetical protein GCM10010350_84430 [Streptomyces galilaeus]|nr:hypothetical protein GCM10010350_84430 [Streptomyces galilaeus]